MTVSGRSILAGAAASAVVAAAAAFLLWPDRGHESLERGAAPAWPSSAVPPPTAAGPATPAASLTPPLGSAEGSDLDRLISAFKQLDGEPTAAKAAQAFLDKPGLKQRYDEFKADQESPAPKDSLGKLAEDLGSKAEFRQLVARFAQDSGFKSILAAAERLPEGRALAARLAGMASSGPAASARGARSAVLAGRGPAGAPAMGAKGSMGAFTALGAAGGSGAAAGTGAVGHGGQPAIDGSVAANAPAAAQDAAAQAQSGANDVSANLGSAGDATTSVLQQFCQMDQYKAFCSNGQVKPEFLKLVPYIQQGKGVWGACFETGIWTECQSACAATSGCSSYDAWDSCMQFNSNAQTCVQQCQQQNLCQNDPGYLAALPPPSGGGNGNGNGNGTGNGTGACSNQCTNPPACNAGPNYEVCRGSPNGVQTDFVYKCTGQLIQCIAAGTPVRVPGGTRPIEDLAVGDPVVSIDEKTGDPVTVHVVGRKVHPDAETLDFRFEGGHLLLTGIHPVYDPDRKAYREASTFKVGDRIALAQESGALKVATLVSIEAGPRRQVLDISVAGPWHNFVAGGVLVHNKNACN